ncbi:receptor-like protein 15 [Helianthus annuus]|uniref:receptor-like protein 15 n=1 Tax=Helianthus annuus TaxID=4232 RepID=UPI0016533CD2|nr:receptor-like protein 15 [Helianthus annuus]
MTLRLFKITFKCPILYLDRSMRDNMRDTGTLTGTLDTQLSWSPPPDHHHRRLIPRRATPLSHLTNLENLDLSFTGLNVTPSIEGCMSLMKLERLHSISLADNKFNKSIISCLSFLPSLKLLDLSSNDLGSSFPLQELSSLRNLNTLDLSSCGLQSLTLNGTMSNLVHLNLDSNIFNIDDMKFIAAFPSLRFLSLERCFIEGGRLFANGVPNLPYLEVLLLSTNNFNETLPIEGQLLSFSFVSYWGI